MSHLLVRLHELVEDEEVPAPARNVARAFVATGERVDDIYLHRLVRALDDCRRGLGSVESVVSAVRICTRFASQDQHGLIRKDPS